MNAELVRLTVVPNEPAAEAIRGLLASDGIESVRRQTDFGAGSMEGWGGGQQEILVSQEDVERARVLIDGS